MLTTWARSPQPPTPHATWAITGAEAKNVARPMLKYLVVLSLGLLALIRFSPFSLWLPRTLGIL